MSGVWEFKTGASNKPATVDPELVHVSTGETVSSYTSLTEILLGLGWKTYDGGNSELLQFVKASDLISLPKDFEQFQGVYKVMVVTNNPGVFKLVKKTGEPEESTATEDL